MNTCITHVVCCTLWHFIPFRLQFYKSLKIKNSSDRKQRTFRPLVRTLLAYLLISFVRPSSGKVRQTAPCIHSLWNLTQVPATPSDMCTNSGQWALHIIQTLYSSSLRNTLSTSDGQCAGFFVFFTRHLTPWLLQYLFVCFLYNYSVAFVSVSPQHFLLSLKYKWSVTLRIVIMPGRCPPTQTAGAPC